MNKPITQLELIPAVDTKAVVPDAAAAAEEIIAKATAALAQAGPDDFDWRTDDSVVVKPRPGIAVYNNRSGDVVIRTQNTDGDEDDFAFISPAGLPAVIKALKDHLP
jgi:hypothetical protein